ncbi:MAG: hypothetical protein FD126_2088 [Elusimicrobia bacterium]|nr:MAG: hypothetical protein FD126_2088 [Elusimicrobiota bacterium]
MAPRTLGQLVADSWELYRSALPEIAAVVAWGAIPAGVLAAASVALTGIDGKETLRAAVDAGEYWRVGAASSLGLFARGLGGLAGLAVYPVAAGRASGARVLSSEAYAYVFERLWQLVRTFVRQILFILLGTLCLVVPGIILAFRYALSQPAVMLEGLNGEAALARSKQFMTGYPGKVLGNMLAAWAMTVLGVLVLVFGVGLGTVLGELVTPQPLHPLLGAFQGVAGGYVDALGGAWLTTFLVLLYGDLMRAHPLADHAG